MTLLVTGYKSKKQLSDCVGKPLICRETSSFANEYRDNGVLAVVHRPTVYPLPGSREFFARVTMRDGLIAKVE